MHLRHLTILAILLAAVFMAGCSQGTGPLAPSAGEQTTDNGRDFTAVTPYDGGHNLGSYQLLLDEEAGTAEIVTPDRTAQKDVTKYATITIEGYSYDPIQRNWYIDVRIANYTPLTGWGALVVFTELAGKKIVGQDGYLYIPGPGGPPERCPVVAYSKMTPERIFPPGHHDIRTIVIHIPPDVPGLAPIEFFIDAWWPGARHEPFVEDLGIMPGPDPGTYHVVGHIRDWQTPMSSHLTVKGFVPIEGADPVIFDLFDDGMHGDGGANDHIWGGDFFLDAPPGHYLCVVKAWDPEDNPFENDIWFKHEGGLPPCDPIPHWLVDEGPMSNIHIEDTWVFYEEPPFVEWWQWLKGPDFPPPPIFWQYHQVYSITLGNRPTTGFWIRIDTVCIDENDVLHVEYTEMIPGDDCPVEYIITRPYIVIGSHRFPDLPVQFLKHVEVYHCPPCEPIPHEIIEEGDSSGIHEPIEAMIWNPGEWEDFYHSHKPQHPVPPVPFDGHGVAVIMLGDRPTGGFWVRLDDVCIDDAGVHIRYTEMIPGPGCQVPPVITQPYMFIVVKAFDVPYIFEGKEEIYECPEECVKFEIFDPGMFSGFHEPALKVINGFDAFNEFWSIHKPGHSAPEINFDNHTVVAVMLGDKPKTGYEVEIKWICLKGGPDSKHWVVHFIVWSPADNCPVAEIVTQPYRLVIAEKFEGDVEWEDVHKVYECPQEDCLWFENIAWGLHSGWHEQNLKVIDGQYGWELFWDVHAPGDPPPPVNWDEHMVVAIAKGDCPTTGFWVDLLKICFNHDIDKWVVDYVFAIPGESINVEPAITQPFTYNIIPRVDGQFQFKEHPIIYEYY